MKIKHLWRSLSLVKLGNESLKLLSKSQRINIFVNTGGSVIQAFLEVISVAAVIPIFYTLLNGLPANSSSTIIKNLALLAGSLHWSTLLALIILIFIVKNLISLWLIYRQTQFIHEVSVSLSEKLYRRFFAQAWTDHLQENSAEMVRKIKTTPSDFANYILQGFLTLATDVCICVLMMGVLIWFDYRIVIIVIVLSTPLVAFYLFFRSNNISKIDKSFRELTPKGNIILTQGIDSFAESKIYHKENYFIDHFMRVRRVTSQQLSNLKLSTGVPSKLFEVLGIMCFAFVIAFSKINPGYQQNLAILLGLLSVAMYRILPSFNRMLTSLSQIQAYSYAVKELKDSFRIPFGNPSSETGSIDFKHSVAFRNVSFKYLKDSKSLLFKNLSITINKGDFLVIEGQSGIGKTTLIHLLAGLIKEYDGSIVIDETTLTSNSLYSWQSKLGFVPQASAVLQGTILSNIGFGEDEKEVNIAFVNRAVELACLDDFIRSLPQQLHTAVGENGLTLSGGQRQRLILARALYRNPEVLLLDEITNQLDEHTKLYILKMLKELTMQKKTIIVASHDPMVRNFASRRLYLKNKEIIEIPIDQISLI